MIGRFGLAACALLCAAGAVPAAAADFLVSYTFASTGKTGSFSLTGDLAADNNRFVVTAINGYTVDGATVAVGPVFDSADKAYGASGAAAARPTLSLDGSFIDFVVYDGGPQAQMVFGVGTELAAAYQQQTGYAGGAAGALARYGGEGPGTRNGFENFEVARYRAVQNIAAVPEAGTWAAMLIGFGGVGATLRRRRSRIAFAA